MIRSLVGWVAVGLATHEIPLHPLFQRGEVMLIPLSEESPRGLGGIFFSSQVTQISLAIMLWKREVRRS